MERSNHKQGEIDEKITQMLIEISSLKHSNNEKNRLNLALVNALAKAKEIEISSRNIFNLKIQKIMIIYQTLERSFKKLFQKYPQIADISGIKSEFEDFSENLKDILKTDLECQNEINSPVKTENDTIRLLLNKMGAYTMNNDRRVSLKRKDTLTKDENSESGFNLEEAINPKMNLEEIMKAFDLED